MSDTLADKLLENAQKPASVTGDQGSVQQHPLPDLIAADRYLKAKAAAKKTTSLGFRITKLTHPGTE